MHIAPIGYTASFKASSTNIKQNSEKPEKKYNPVALTGKLSIGFLSAAAITGYLHMKKSHMASSLLTAGAVTAHILSLNPHEHDHTA